MHTLSIPLISTLFWLGAIASFAQEAENVEKTLMQAVAATKGASVAIPMMEQNSSKDRLSKVVGSAVDGTLKAARKTSLWSVQDLGSAQIGEITLSGSPFTTLFEIKGSAARSEFEGMINAQLAKKGAFEMLEELDSGVDRNELLRAVTESMLAELDENGSRLFDSM